MPPDDVKTFLLGVGCQKGGTTWLRDYLAQAPECSPGFDTEYTIFDSLDVPEHAWVRPGIVARAPPGRHGPEGGRPLPRHVRVRRGERFGVDLQTLWPSSRFL